VFGIADLPSSCDRGDAYVKTLGGARQCDTIAGMPPRRRRTKTTAEILRHPEVLAALRELGRQGGKKGARARWENVPPEKRSEGARKAALARWRRK
jgi:hypothetical protein